MAAQSIRAQLDARLHSLLPDTRFSCMSSDEDRQEVIHMRTEGYRRSFPVSENWEGFTDPFDEDHNTRTFGVYVHGTLCSIIRLSIITEKARDAQAMVMYGDLLNSKLDDGRVLMDVTRLVVNPDMAEEVPELPYLTFRVVAMACQHYGVDETVSALRSKHVPFYRRMFGGRALGEPVWYPPLRSDFSLVVFPLSVISEDLATRFSSWLSTPEERLDLFGPPETIAGIDPSRSLAA